VRKNYRNEPEKIFSPLFANQLIALRCISWSSFITISPNPKKSQVPNISEISAKITLAKRLNLIKSNTVPYEKKFEKNILHSSCQGGKKVGYERENSTVYVVFSNNIIAAGKTWKGGYELLV
jgi:hypothetical protein